MWIVKPYCCDRIGTPEGERGPWSRKHTFKDGSSEIRAYNKDTMHERSWNRVFEREGYFGYKLENRERHNTPERAQRREFSQANIHRSSDDW